MKQRLIAALATGLLLIGLAGMASATTLGNDIVSRSVVDNFTNFTMIDLDLQFSDTGRIDTWSIFAQNKTTSHNAIGHDVYLQTFRLVTGNTYQIVGENLVTVSALGALTFDIATAEEIQYQAGDYIGWSFTDLAVFGFDYATDQTMYSSNGGMKTGVGSLISFAGSTNRDYSIAANTAPVPEPGTIVLLGAGLAGLGIYRRRSKK